MNANISFNTHKKKNKNKFVTSLILNAARRSMGLPPTQGHNNLRLPNTSNMYYNHRLDNILQHNSYNNQHHFFYHYYYQNHQNHHHHNQLVQKQKLLQLQQQQHQSQQIHAVHRYLNQYSNRMSHDNDGKDFYRTSNHFNYKQTRQFNDNEIFHINNNNNKNYDYYEISTDHFGPFNSSYANRSYRFDDMPPSTSTKPDLKKSILNYCRCLNNTSIFNNECHSKSNLWYPNYRCTYRKYLNVCGNIKYTFCTERLLGKHKKQVPMQNEAESANI